MQKLSFILLFFSFLGFSQRGEISLEEIEKQREKDKKMVAILFSTEWCSICKVQKRTLGKMPDEFWENVYFTTINPEKYTKDISFLGKKYAYVANGTSGLHRIIFEWAGQRVPAYPFWVFIDEQENFATYEGLLNQTELEKITKINKNKL